MAGSRASACAATSAHAANAQTQSTAGAASLEEVVVTGSRLKSANETSISPITSVTSDDIQATGLTRATVSDLVESLVRGHMVTELAPRAAVGAGPQRMNRLVVRQAAADLARLEEEARADREHPGPAILPRPGHGAAGVQAPLPRSVTKVAPTSLRLRPGLKRAMACRYR